MTTSLHLFSSVANDNASDFYNRGEHPRTTTFGAVVSLQGLGSSAVGGGVDLGCSAHGQSMTVEREHGEQTEASVVGG